MPGTTGRVEAGVPGQQSAIGWWICSLLTLGYFFINVLALLPGITVRQCDFGTFFYPAAQAVLAGKSPYSVTGFIYPPLFPLVLVPLALAPFACARVIWFALCHAMAIAAGYWTWRAFGQDRFGAVAVIGAWATSGALFVDLREGQVNTLLLLLVVVAIWPPRRGSWIGPMALASSVALKIWPGVVLIGDVISRRWKNILRVCALTMVLLLLAWTSVRALVSGPTAPARADFWAGSPGALNGSLPGLVLRLLDRPKAGAQIPSAWVEAHSVETFRMTRLQASISLGAAIGLFGAGFLAVARTTRSSPGVSERPLVYAASLALALGAAPVVWPHYHVLQLPGIAILADRSLRERAWGRLLVLGAASLGSTWASVLLTGPYLTRFGFTVSHPSLLWTLTSLPPIGAAAIWLLLIVEMRR
jgi:Glycosyltransferase family 87